MFLTTYASLASNQNETTWILSSTMDLGDFILLAISLIVFFAWIFSIMYILWWGVLLILSWWKEDKIKPAINSIRYALIWLWSIVLAIFIFPKIAWLLWLDVSKYSSPEKIFSEIKTLWDKVLWNDTSWVWEGGDIKDLDTLPADFSDL